MPHLVATLIYLSQIYSYYIWGDRSPYCSIDCVRVYSRPTVSPTCQYYFCCCILERQNGWNPTTSLKCLHYVYCCILVGQSGSGPTISLTYTAENMATYDNSMFTSTLEMVTEKRAFIEIMDEAAEMDSTFK